MPTKRIAIFNQDRGKQHGAIMLAILVILIIGAAAFLLRTLNSSSLQIARNKVTADALAKAKDALISYAITYGDTHPGQAYGYLPCPDPNGNAGVNGEGSSETCGNSNVSAIGRLPWKTLGLPPLRDGNGECLWYAVAGTYKNNPSPTYTLMNWDNYGLFQILAANGVTLAGQTPESYAVAAIFAPGTALTNQYQTQNRTPDGNAPICGGNYNASNYLDRDTSITPNAHNATPSTTANAISTFYNAGATANINDQIIYITSNDIFNAIKKRNDFSAFVNSMLSNAISNLNLPYSSLPTPVVMNFSNTNPLSETANTNASGYLYIGKIPKAYLSAQYQNWQDNLQYGKCAFGGNCLTVNGVQCDGIIIFTGEQNAAQSRTLSNKNLPSDYLESPIFSPFSNGKNSSWPYSPVTFTGPTSYIPTSPSTDVLACIQ